MALQQQLSILCLSVKKVMMIYVIANLSQKLIL